MGKRVSVAFVAAVLMAVTASLAATQVTVILKSGDRVKGNLVDISREEFVLRVLGAERRFERGEVAVLDFSGAPIPEAEASRIREGRALVILRDGGSFYGVLYGIGGTSPLRFAFGAQEGDREVHADQVARIYFSRWEGASQPTPDAPHLDPGGEGTPIPANPCWTNTGRSVRKGQRVTFNGTGEIQLSADRNDIAGVAGSRTGRTAPNAPLPGALAGALIGRVGNSRPFGIGDQKIALGMPAAGQLFLGINDDHCADNRGQFKVQINVLR
jgi:hypothetical protein